VDPLELQVAVSSKVQKQRDVELAEAMENAESDRPSLEQQLRNAERMRDKRQYLLLMTPMLPGYSLKNNQWRKFITGKYVLAVLICLEVWFYVDNLQSITETGEAFDHLVFPEDQKNLLLTFVQRHQLSEQVGDDVITGKGTIFNSKKIYCHTNSILGQGLTILLSGPPGTGKTLTAESSKIHSSCFQT